MTYFSPSSGPSPPLHTWSLAIEEQFSLVWPLVVLGVLKLGATRRGRRADVRPVDVLGGGRMVVVPTNGVVSPERRYAPSVSHVNVRCADGVHFTRSGSILVGLTLAPELAALGQAHAAASPDGTWPGTLPPSTPPWFPSLPCQ